MAKDSAIEWTHHTFNPWVGCTKVSPGCLHCYAESYDKRVGGVPVKQRKEPEVAELRWGVGARRTRTTPTYWRQPIAWNTEATRLGVRQRVFCASLADVFDAAIDDVWRVELFDLIRRTSKLDWLLLTKRPQNIRPQLSNAIDAYVRAADATMETADMLQAWGDGKPPANVWLGTTVEDQLRADERIPVLLAVPAAVRFLSCEPLLESVDLRRVGKTTRGIDLDALTGWVTRYGYKARTPNECSINVSVAKELPPIDWVIVGGESGAGARPFQLEWARSLVQQCRNAGRPAPFVKQLGARPLSTPTAHLSLADSHGGDWAEWPADLRVREYPEVRP